MSYSLHPGTLGDPLRTASCTMHWQLVGFVLAEQHQARIFYSLITHMVFDRFAFTRGKEAAPLSPRERRKTLSTFTSQLQDAPSKERLGSFCWRSRYCNTEFTFALWLQPRQQSVVA